MRLHVGAFLAPTRRTTTITSVDGKVIHIASNAMIFRASGNDQRSANATTYGMDAMQSEQAIKGLNGATTDFGNALIQTLDRFEKFDASKAVALAEVLQTDKDVDNNDNSVGHWASINEYKAGGGGSSDMILLGLILAALAYHQFGQRRLKQSK